MPANSDEVIAILDGCRDDTLGVIQGPAAIGGLIELDPTERDTLDPHALAVRELGATTRLALAVRQSAGGALVERPHFSGASLALLAPPLGAKMLPKPAPNRAPSTHEGSRIATEFCGASTRVGGRA
jgi:hypothetical protein